LSSRIPLAGFRDLAFDLENCAGDFLTGSGEVLVRASQKESAYIGVQNQGDMARWVGDTTKREEAHRLFREKKFQQVVDILESLTYPELLMDSEKTFLEISRKKTTFVSKLRRFLKRS